jgi:hypothetical protein
MQNEKCRMQNSSPLGAGGSQTFCILHSAFCILHSAFCILHLSRPPRLVSRQCLLLFREALICLSYSGSAFALGATAR